DTGALAAAAGALTVTELSGNQDALRRELATAARTGAQVTAGWNLAADRTTDERQLTSVAQDAYLAGARSLALYAYDLAPAQRLAWLSDLSRLAGGPDTAEPAPSPPLPEPVT
ncbi:hypothetical protein ACFW89_33405, partial [Streptomyces albidoflavus]